MDGKCAFELETVAVAVLAGLIAAGTVVASVTAVVIVAAVAATAAIGGFDFRVVSRSSVLSFKFVSLAKLLLTSTALVEFVLEIDIFSSSSSWHLSFHKRFLMFIFVDTLCELRMNEYIFVCCCFVFSHQLNGYSTEVYSVGVRAVHTTNIITEIHSKCRQLMLKKHKNHPHKYFHRLHSKK